MLVSRVQKWGNSQGLRLPKQLLELAGIAIGEEVEIAVANQQITVRKAARTKYDLAELVSHSQRLQSAGSRLGTTSR